MSPRHLVFRLVGSTAIGLLFLLAGPAAFGDGLLEGAGNPRTGRDLFVSKGCVRCHSVWGTERENKRGPNLASVGMGRNLYELCASIWSHWLPMNAALEAERTARTTLTPTEFRDIIAYIYFLNYSGEPGDATQGSTIFSEKGCSRCHAVEPILAQGKPARPVYAMQEFQSPVTLAVAVWSHGAGMLRTMSQRGVGWPEFDGKQVSHLVEFIRSRSAAARQPEMALLGNPSRGSSLFTSKSCALCHSSQIQASQVEAKPIPGGYVSLNVLVANLWNHFPKMSRTISSSALPLPQISRQEMEDLLAYIYWPKAYRLSGDVATGRMLYHSKHCASCHSPADGKPPLAPDLMKNGAVESVYSLLSALWNHGPQMESRLRLQNISWPALKGDEMRHLVTFLRKGTDAHLP